MKKGLVCILALALTLSFVACSSNKLADNYSEEDVFARAKEVVDVINSLDYDAMNAQLRDDLQDQLTAEQLEEVWATQLEEAGAFEKYENTVTMSQKSKSTGEDYAAAILTGKYENSTLTFTIVMDKDMEIVGMYIK